MKGTTVGRTQRFDDNVFGCLPPLCLKSFLEHRFVVCRRSRGWIGALQLLAESVMNESGGCGKPTIEKDCSGERFQNIRKKSSFAATAALFLSATKAEKVA